MSRQSWVLLKSPVSKECNITVLADNDVYIDEIKHLISILEIGIQAGVYDKDATQKIIETESND